MVNRDPVTSVLHAEIALNREQVFRWWSDDARQQEGRTRLQRLPVRDFTWEESSGPSGFVDSYVATWITRLDVSVRVHCSRFIVSDSAFRTETFAERHYRNGLIQTTTISSAFDFSEQGADSTALELTTIWQATELSWWEYLPRAHRRRVAHIEQHHLKANMARCLAECLP